MGSHLINDLAFVGPAIIAADQGGYLTILESNLEEPDDISKTTITSVGRLYLGE